METLVNKKANSLHTILAYLFSHKFVKEEKLDYIHIKKIVYLEFYFLLRWD